MSLEVTFLCNFLEDFEQDRCQLFSKFLVEFSCEAVWTSAFVCVVCCDLSIFIPNFIDLIFLPLCLDVSG